MVLQCLFTADTISPTFMPTILIQLLKHRRSFESFGPQLNSVKKINLQKQFPILLNSIPLFIHIFIAFLTFIDIIQ